MVPRVCRRVSAVLVVLLSAGVLSVASVDAAAQKSAAEMLRDSRTLRAKGETAEALALLRSLRDRYPSSAEASDALALSIEIYLSQGDVFRARYLFGSLSATAPKSPSIGRTAFSIAEYCYGKNLPAALDYYLIAVENEDRASVGPDAQRARLRAAELSLYRAGDPDTARYHLSRVVAQRLSADDLPAYRALSIRLRWEDIPASALGVADSNVSFLLADGGDIWVGTWNGGVARYSIATGTGTPFTRTAVTSRSAEAADKRIWVGTSEGLAWFSKSTGRWGMAEEFQSPSPRNVKALCAAGGALYAGTLGDGLFRLRGDTWEKLGSNDVPGVFITCLSADDRGNRLFIGTMDSGPFVLDMGTDRITQLAAPGLSRANITTILRDEYGTIWIGTYGTGLYRLRPGASGIEKFDRQSGEIADDWVLAAAETPRAVYFGTFGGGVSLFSKEDDSWRRLGIADGLPSLDVTSIASVGPYVFFGTLGGGVVRYLEGDSVRP